MFNKIASWRQRHIDNVGYSRPVISRVGSPHEEFVSHACFAGETAAQQIRITATKPMDQRVSDVISFIDANLRQALSIADLAKQSGISPAHLRRLFKTDTGVAPMQYLRRARMRRAQVLLETSTLSVKEIAAKIGLNDVSHFVRDFDAMFGLTPNVFRERFRKPHRK